LKKTFRKQQEESQIVWRNQTNEPAFNPNRLTKYYAVINIGGKSFVTDYEAKYRREAEVIFNEEASLAGGYVEVVRAYK
jgi:GMP synthase-like glutamine amidotransferase